MKILYYLLFMSILLGINSCQKLDLPKGTPSCLKKEIRKIIKEDNRNPLTEVWEYKYEGETVYYIPPYCCDNMSVLLDDK